VTGRHFEASESALEGAKLALRQVLTGAEELKQVLTCQTWRSHCLVDEKRG
jgi:hypothetical protein